MKRTIVAGLIIVSVLTASCADSLPSFSSAREMADALGCADLESRKAQRVEESAVCEFNGERVAIFSFRDEEQRDEWMKFGARFSDDLIVGPDWALDPPEGAAEEIREALL